MPATAIASFAVYFALSELDVVGLFLSQGSALLHLVLLILGLRPFVVSSNAANSTSFYSFIRYLACSHPRCRLRAFNCSLRRDKSRLYGCFFLLQGSASLHPGFLLPGLCPFVVLRFCFLFLRLLLRFSFPSSPLRSIVHSQFYLYPQRHPTLNLKRETRNMKSIRSIAPSPLHPFGSSPVLILAAECVLSIVH